MRRNFIKWFIVVLITIFYIEATNICFGLMTEADSSSFYIGLLGLTSMWGLLAMYAYEKVKQLTK